MFKVSRQVWILRVALRLNARVTSIVLKFFQPKRLHRTTRAHKTNPGAHQADNFLVVALESQCFVYPNGDFFVLHTASYHHPIRKVATKYDLFPVGFDLHGVNGPGVKSNKITSCPQVMIKSRCNLARNILNRTYADQINWRIGLEYEIQARKTRDNLI